MSLLDFLSAPVGSQGLMGQPYPTVNRLGLFGAGLKDLGNNINGVQSDDLQKLRLMALLNSQAKPQNDTYQSTLARLSAPSQPNEVSVTPQVTDPSQLPQRVAAGAYNQPAMSDAGPLAGSPMADLLKSMPADQGLPMLMSTMQPHGVQTVNDASGVPHVLDKLTGKELFTIGGPKPIEVAPGHSLVVPGQGDQSQPLTLPRLQAALTQQESGGNPNIGTSVDGAVGPSQILPATFAQYAKPGENINNPADNQAVQGRILTDYAQRFGGDPARIAVAYFSGPNNVAPAGSATPWIKDAKDGNGKSVSSYVSDVIGRLQPQQGGSGYKTVFSAPPPQEVPLTADELKTYNALLGSTRNSVTGNITRASSANSPPSMDASQMDSLAASFNLTGHLPAGMGRGGQAAQQILARADALAPPQIRQQGPQALAQWRASNAQNYIAGNKAVSAFDSGKQGDQTRFINNAFGHLSLLRQYAQALGNGDVQTLNSLKQRWNQEFGSAAPTNFESLKDLVGNEIVKSVTNSGGSAGERDATRGTLAKAGSPAQLIGAIDTYQGVLGRQAAGLARQYKASTGRDDYASKYLAPEAVPYFQQGMKVPGQSIPISPANLPRKATAPNILRYDASGNRIQ